MARHSHQGRSPTAVMPRLSLGHIRRLGASGQWQEAFDELSTFIVSFPKNVTALEMIGDAAYEIGDTGMMWFSAWQLHQIQPGKSVRVSNLAMAAVANSMPFSVFHYAEQFMRRWPQDAYVSALRDVHNQYKAVCDKIKESEPDHVNHTYADLALMEEAQQLVSLGHYAEGRKVNQRAVERMPEMAAPRNNLALTYLQEGNLLEALRLSRETFERFPQNFHARCNLAQVLVRGGDRDGARHQMTIVPALSDLKFDDKMKWVETLAYIGDDEQQVKLYEQLRQDKELWSHLPGMTRHLLAVSLARNGDTKQAQKLWQDLQQNDSGFEEARANLDDLKKNPGERNGPWPFQLWYWVPRQIVEQLAAIVFSANDKDALDRKLERQLKDKPAVLAVMSILLERGDPVGRQFALHMASVMPVNGLKEFVLGPNGTDLERMTISEYAADYGLLERGKPLLIWQGGKQTELIIMGFEIDGEPGPPIEPPAAQELFQQSFDAYHEKDYAAGLRYAEEALKLAPDVPAVMNQVAAMLEANGRAPEARVMTERLATQHPDYLFARVGMARQLTKDGKFDEARTQLQPLLGRTRFHFSEFRALQIAQIELLLAEENFDGAESQLAMWEDTDPDAPQIEHYQMQLMLKQLPGRIASLMERGKKRTPRKKRKK